MKKTKILLGLLIAYALNGCSLFGETEPDLPPPTQIGANTIGFKVNGKNWVPKDEAKFVTRPKMGAGANWNQFIFSITAVQIDRDNKFQSTLDLDLYDFTSYKKYSQISMVYNNKWSANNKQPWQLTISKLDTVNQICAGTFSFVGVAADGSTVNITDGRFDFKYSKE